MPKIGKVVHVMRRCVPGKWGGTETAVFSAARALEERGVESPVFCTSMLSEPGPETLRGVRVRRFRYCFPWFGLSKHDRQRLTLKGGSPLAPGLFLALLREKNVSLIHTHVQHRLGGMARTAARLKGIPYVVSVHGGHFTLPPEQVDKMTEPFRGKFEWGKLFGWLLGSRRVLDDAAAIICVGRSEYAAMKERYPSKHIHYIPNGVSVEWFAKADGSLFREAFGYAGREKIVLCVSRIDYQKNQLGLVRAFAVFSKTHPDHRLVLIGPATVESYLAEVKALIRSLGVEERVRIIEGLEPDDPLLAAAYKAAEIFVLPTHHEPFGIVVLEAWAAGCPVLAYRVGGISGFAEDRRTALLVEKDDEAALHKTMQELAGDPNLRKMLAEAAFSEVEARYDWAQVNEQIRSVYERFVRD
jgi:glycosyltransferase involved in cell wall biosynthesis